MYVYVLTDTLAATKTFQVDFQGLDLLYTVELPNNEHFRTSSFWYKLLHSHDDRTCERLNVPCPLLGVSYKRASTVAQNLAKWEKLTMSKNFPKIFFKHFKALTVH